MKWIKNSKILWTAEHAGRRFRIEKQNSTYSGQAILVEVDEYQRVLRKEIVRGYREAVKVAEKWL